MGGIPSVVQRVRGFLNVRFKEGGKWNPDLTVFPCFIHHNLTYRSSTIRQSGRYSTSSCAQVISPTQSNTSKLPPSFPPSKLSKFPSLLTSKPTPRPPRVPFPVTSSTASTLNSTNVSVTTNRTRMTHSSLLCINFSGDVMCRNGRCRQRSW